MAYQKLLSQLKYASIICVLIGHTGMGPIEHFEEVPTHFLKVN